MPPPTLWRPGALSLAGPRLCTAWLTHKGSLSLILAFITGGFFMQDPSHVLSDKDNAGLSAASFSWLTERAV